MRSGHRIRASLLDVRWLATAIGRVRVGILVPKFRYNAVQRNRLKRRLRELARSRILPLSHSVDVLIRARPDAYDASFERLQGDITAIGVQLR